MIPQDGYNAFPLRCFDDNPAHSWTFFFAHPDDELAVGAWMNHLVKIGCEVRASWAHCSAVRREESLAAMEIVGLLPVELAFGTLPDGQFDRNMIDLDSWVRDVVERFPADRYVSVAFEQGHLDHDSLNLMVNRWTGPAHLEFPMYWHYARTWQRIGEFADPSGEEKWALSPDQADMKRHMLACFESQTVARNVAAYELFARLTGQDSPLFLTERLRQVATRDYLQPVHREPIRSRILRSRRWARWEEAAKEWVGSDRDPEWTRQTHR